MKRIHCLIYAFLFLQSIAVFTAAKAGAEQNPDWDFTPDPQLPDVLILGDSVSIGYTRQVREILKDKANVFRSMKSNGRPMNCGGTTKGLKGIDRWLGGREWAVVHYNWGLHDLKHVKKAGSDELSNNPDDPTQTSVVVYSRKLKALTAKIKATGARPIFATTTPVAPGTLNPYRDPSDPERYNAAAIKIMEANNVRVNDLFSFAKPHLAEWQRPKDVHFHPKGSAALAGEVAAAIAEELAQSEIDGPKAPADNQVKPKTRARPKDKPTYLETGGERKLDVVYKQVGKRRLQIDIYYPTAKRTEKPPVIIYTHGGGWAAGSRMNISKGLHAPLFIRLLSEGFCVVSVDYRLYNKSGTVAMRDCVIDSKDAVRYLAKHAGSLEINPDRFYVMGDSAGGQIAQMLLLSDAEALQGDPALADAEYKIHGGVSWYGPCDFENQNLFNHDDRPDFKDRFGPRIVISEASPEERLALYREMSPVNYLTQDSPPLLMIQGDQDTTIPVKHALYMQQRAEKLEAEVETMIVSNAGHNWKKVGSDIQPTLAEIIDKTVRFYTDLNIELTEPQ